MPKNPKDQHKPSTKKIDGKVHIRVAATLRSSGHVRIRKIRRSPVTDPKKVESARASAQRLKLKKMERFVIKGAGRDWGDLDDLDVPFITPGL